MLCSDDTSYLMEEKMCDNVQFHFLVFNKDFKAYIVLSCHICLTLAQGIKDYLYEVRLSLIFLGPEFLGISMPLKKPTQRN